jgi:chemotaxis protein MotB
MGYSDMMTALAMVFLFVLTSKTIEQDRQTDSMRDELERTQTELETARARHDELERTYSRRHAQLRDRLSVRARLVERLGERLEGLDASVRFDTTTGAIQLIGADTLFDEKSKTLRKGARRKLDEVMPKYLEALFEDDLDARYIERIVIEGHANSNTSYGVRKGYLKNLELSQGRAREAMKYIVNADWSVNDDALRLLSVGGFSNIRPVTGKDGAEDKVRSRRIEVRFELKDGQFLDDLDKTGSSGGSDEKSRLPPGETHHPSRSP